MSSRTTFYMKFTFILVVPVLFLITGICSCRGIFTRGDRVVIIQPLGDFPEARARAVFEQIQTTHPGTVLRPSIALPAMAYYASRGRYRADSLIAYLKNAGCADSVVIGLTDKDISTTKGKNADWGIMGLAYTPGNACVVSSFRLDRRKISDQFYKVAIHELGHTQGLPHCRAKSCFMRDAEGGNRTDELIHFCPECRSFLVRKGWRLAD